MRVWRWSYRPMLILTYELTALPKIRAWTSMRSRLPSTNATRRNSSRSLEVILQAAGRVAHNRTSYRAYRECPPRPGRGSPLDNTRRHPSHKTNISSHAGCALVPVPPCAKAFFIIEQEQRYTQLTAQRRRAAILHLLAIASDFCRLACGPVCVCTSGDEVRLYPGF